MPIAAPSELDKARIDDINHLAELLYATIVKAKERDAEQVARIEALEKTVTDLTDRLNALPRNLDLLAWRA